MKTISLSIVFTLAAAALTAQQPQAEPPAMQQEELLNSFQRLLAKQLNSAMETIRMGAPIEARNKQGMTALMLAAAAGDENTFNDLLHLYNANIKAEAPGRVNMLMLAAAGGNENIFNTVQRHTAVSLCLPGG